MTLKSLFRKSLPQFIFLIILINISLSAFAQAGVLDPHFGQQGKVITYFNGVSVDVRASALQADGKIICVGGYTSIQPSGGFIIIRYMPDGTLDSSFGDQGKIFTDFGYDYELATGVAITPDNNIIVGGYGSNGFVTITYDILLSKYKPNGSFDSSFGVNGKVSKNFGQDEYIYSTLLQEDGKIILSGNNIQDFLITRFNSNGQSDLSFGTNGLTTTDFSDREFGRCSAIQKDGKIILAGFKNLSHPQFCLARYLSNGQLDPDFGNQGKVVTNLSGGDERIYAIGLQSDGKIVIGGESRVTYTDHDNGNMTLARYNIDGTLDMTFGKNGTNITVFDNLNTTTQSVLIRPDDKITAVGFSYDYNYEDLNFALAAYTENGNIDSSFGADGRVVTDFGGFETHASGLLQPDGKVILTGMTTNLEETEYKVALARYFDRPQQKYVRIKKWLHKHGITWEDKPENNFKYYSIQRSSDGIDFKEIGKVSSQNGNIQKTFEDLSQSTGKTFYRVVAFSIDKTKSYSNNIVVDDDALSIKFYPNPVKIALQIDGLSGANKLSISDLNGNTRMVATANASLFTWNIAQLQKGNYILTIQNNSSIVTKSFIKE